MSDEEARGGVVGGDLPGVVPVPLESVPVRDSAGKRV
jgi:hypothetical protein